MTTAVQMQLRRDTAVNLAAATPAQGELGVDTTRNRLAVGDGSTAGGWPHAKIQDAQGYGFVANYSLAAAVASNNLTITLNAANGNAPAASNSVFVPFRSATLATGTPSLVEITSALTIVLANGDTIGAANGVPFRLWVVLYNNGGTPVLGVINCVVGGASPTQVKGLNEALLVSPTSTIGNSAGVFYSAASVAGNSAFRILGYVEFASGLTTAGTYNTGPSTIQLFGPGCAKPGDVVDRVFSASITPTSAVNLVRVTASGGFEPQTTANVTFSLKRGATTIASVLGSAFTNTNYTSVTVAGVLDSPETTSSTTYSLSVPTGSAGNIYYLLEELMG